MDWDYFSEVSYSELNNDSKEELCGQLSSCKVDPEATEEELRNVLILAQKLLQFRDNQIEDIKNESAAKIEKLRQENDELENQASSSKRARKASEARQEAVRLQKENKDLLVELQMLKTRFKGKDPMLDNEEEDYRAEKEKQKMKKTVELQTEHIASLLSDLEGAEAENLKLKEHLSNLRDKLAEATEALAENTADLTKSQKINLEIKNRYIDARDETESLRRQISELVDQRTLLDSQLYSFQQAMETRVDTWKNMMDKKDGEITELKQQVLFSTPEQYALLQDTVSALTQSLATRDQQVNELSSRLVEATKELEESTEALEKLRNNKGDGETRKLWQQLQRAVTRERALEARIEEAEKDALVRGEQVTELSTHLQKLEKGEFGLPEALAEARELKRCVAVRDADIARLIKTTNQLQNSLDELSDQNLALRERFGVTEEEIDVSGVKERRASERQIIESLLKQVATLEQEKVTLKLQFRELKKGKTFEESDEEPSHRDSNQVDVTLLIEENESLRKGMHEILESIRSQDAQSDVHVESSCLERLLEALDARHVAGWYHPAMRLQAQLQNAQGIATELREQLRFSREQEKMWKEQIKPVLERTESLKATDDIRPAPTQRRPMAKFRASSDPEWNQRVRGAVDDVAKSFRELSRSIPLLANAGRDHEEELKQRIADLEDSINEYKAHLDKEKEHSVAACAAKCATQRIAERCALRKCHALEAARQRLSGHLENKTMEAIEKEARLNRDIANLNAKDIDLKNEIKSLENLLQACVPEGEFIETQRELQQTSEALRKSILDQNKSDLQTAEILKLKDDVKNYELRVADLIEELKKEKAKLRVLEAQGHYPDAEQQVVSLGQKLGALEVSEATAMKRADHAEKMYQLSKEQIIELEKEKHELEETSLQKLSILPSELPVVEQKRDSSSEINSSKIVELEAALSASQQQIQSMQNLFNNRSIEIDEVRKQNQRLQSSGDLQATLGRVSEEVLALRLDGENYKFKIDEANSALSAAKSKSDELERNLKEISKQKTRMAVEIHSREKMLKQKLASICSRHTACVPISTFSQVTQWLASIREKSDQFENVANTLKQTLHEVESELEEVKLENASASELVDVLKADSKDMQKQQIQEWHSRNMQLRIKELESTRKAERLEKECEELRCQTLNLRNHSRNLEDKRLELEKSWEQRLMCLELEKCMEEGLFQQTNNVAKQSEPQMTVEDLDVEPEEQENKPLGHPHKKLVRRGTFTLLHESPDVLKKEIASKEERITHLEKLLDGQQGDSRAKLALEAMVGSLSELVSLKESAVLRARQRAKEANDEHVEVTKEMRRQIADLQNSLARMQGAKVKEQVTPELSPGPTVTRLLTQVHTLEDELRVSNHSAATLAGQLRTLNGELQRWKDLADARHAKLQSLQDRYEEEISQAIASKISNFRTAEKADTEISEKQLTFRSNQELLKSQQEVENLREMLAHMQEQIKKLQAKVNEKKNFPLSPSKPAKEQPEPPQKVQEKPAMQPRFDNAKVANIVSKLQAQVKQLQEEIESLKDKEIFYLEQSKAKSTEVVSRWEERKRLQGKCSKLAFKLQESEANAKKLKESNQALRALIERLEREKILLDQQIRRKIKSAPIPQRSTPADIQLGKARAKLSTLEEECASLRRQLEHYKRIADDMPRMRAETATVRAKFENQREAAVQMQSKIARLEAANLELNLKIDDLASARQNDDQGDSSDDGLTKEELQRSVLLLGQHVRRLQEKLRAARSHDSSVDSLGGETSQKLIQAEVRRKLENDVSHLRRERSELRAQLNQKISILVEVRAALQEASLREAALKAEISNLRRSAHK